MRASNARAALPQVVLRAAVAAAIGSLLALCLAPAPASAATSLCTLGEAAGQCKEPGGLAIDEATGRLYLADLGNNRVDVFDAETEAFLFAFGWDVNAEHPEEKLQTCTEATGCREGSLGAGPGQLSAPRQIAVDNTGGPHQGDVYVGFGNFRVQRFGADGSFQLAFGWGVRDGTKEAQTCGPEASPPSAGCQAGVEGVGPGQFYALFGGIQNALAVGPGGVLYASDTAKTGATESEGYTDRVELFEPSGAFAEQRLLFPAGHNHRLDGGGLAVAADGAFYVVEELGPIIKYDSSGAELESFAAGDTTGAICLDPAGRLFAQQSDGESRVITEYDSSGAILSRFGYGQLTTIVWGLAAYHSAAGDVYFSQGFSTIENKVQYLKLPPPGPLAAGPKAEGITSFKATLRGEVNPEGGAGTEVHFEYLTQAEFEEQGESFEGPATESSAAQPLGAEDFHLHPVEATIGCPDPETEAEEGKCLAPQTEYRWRIVATNEDSEGPGEGTLEGVLATTAPIEILEVWPTAVGTDAATLHARVNPFGVPATGYFEYVTEASYEADVKAGGDGFAAAARLPASPGELEFDAEEGATASATAIGLEEGTAYRFRVSATNPLLEEGLVGEEHRSFATFAASAPVGCADEGARGGLVGARTGFGAFLPDCRAYELVSPVDKNGADIVFPYTGNNRPARLEQSSTGGERMAYNAQTSFAESEGAPWSSQYVATRRAGEEWQSHGISSPRSRSLVTPSKQANAEFELFSPDLCQGWLRTFSDPPLTPDAIEGNLNLYRRSDEECGGRSYEALTTIAPEHVSAANDLLALQGASHSGRRAIYRINDTLPGTGAPPEPATCTGESAPAECQMHLYSVGLGEATRYLCVLPGGTTAASCAAGTFKTSVEKPNLQNAISADGRRVFWSTPAPGDGRIYVRENPEAPESPRVHGAAWGTGNVIGPAKGSGRILKNHTEATGVRLEGGGFVVGQELTDSAEALPAATKITAVELEKEEEAGSQHIYYYKLSLDQAAEKNALSDTFTGHASATVTDLSAESGAFEAGQSIEGAGIPAGTSVEALGAGTLTLSEIATASHEGAGLEAFSPCARPLSGACTTPISRDAELQEGTSASLFWGASEDGGRAIFSTGDLSFGEAALYSYGVQAESTRRIAGRVYGVAGIDEDAGRVYFATGEVLAGANVEAVDGEGAEAIEGEPNLYLYEAGAGAGEEGSYAFIGTLAAADAGGQSAAGPLASEPVNRLSRVTPSGGALAFMSRAPLSGFDNTDAGSGEADMELFLYEAGSGRLVCASCAPSGARPIGADPNRSYELSAPPSAGWIPAWESSLYASRALSEDGRRLFFESAEKLRAGDTDGHVDVYQWEAPGEGSCATGSPSYVTASAGCVDLISSGLGARDAEFRDASPSGEDVFFSTQTSLLPQDYGLVDIYDARAGGGLPVPQPAAPGCEGEACQSPPPAPEGRTAASEAFHGPGNARPAKQRGCPKGKRKVRRKGRARCVKRHKAHRRHPRHHRPKQRKPRAGRSQR